jgi:hypothetical protein
MKYYRKTPCESCQHGECTSEQRQAEPDCPFKVAEHRPKVNTKKPTWVIRADGDDLSPTEESGK